MPCWKEETEKKKADLLNDFEAFFFLDVSGAGDRIYWNYSAVKLYNVVTEGQGAWKRALDPRMSARFVSERSGTQFSSSSSCSRNLLLSRPSDWSKNTTTSTSFPHRARAVWFGGRQFLKCAGSEAKTRAYSRRRTPIWRSLLIY